MGDDDVGYEEEVDVNKFKKVQPLILKYVVILEEDQEHVATTNS